MPEIQYLIRWVSCFFEKWQTLIAGILALVGAWWTVNSIQRQISQVDSLETQRNEREERAARAMLPLALSETDKYSIKCIKLLNDHFMDDFTRIAHADQINLEFIMPKIPDSVFSVFQLCAKYADQTNANLIHELILWFQIQNSRLEDFINRLKEGSHATLGHEARNAVLDAAELHAKCIDLFHYARGNNPIQMTFQEKLDNALFLANIHDEELSKLVKERHSPYMLTCKK